MIMGIYHNTLYIVYMYVLIILVYTLLHVMHYVYMCYVIQLCMAAYVWYNVLTPTSVHKTYRTRTSFFLSTIALLPRTYT